MKQKVPTYVASPYGFAESTRSWYYEKLLPILGQYVHVLDPWLEPIPRADDGSIPIEGALRVGAKHLANIKDNTRLLVAGLDQEPPDSGTVVEVAWAAAHNIPVIAYRADYRTSGEDGLRYNLMIGAAVRHSGGVEVNTLQELGEQVARYAAAIEEGWNVTSLAP